MDLTNCPYRGIQIDMSNQSTTSRYASEVQSRRTFAIISHPDAGKTTLTEKLLLYGGAIRLAGSVKGRKAQRHATSDWMELERQRGISVTSTVLNFTYRGYQVNILDTPGHQDFSEDTYRTLTAADSAVMLIDVAKGVEPQTKKLFHVCRLRGIPIFTFVNKLDRFGKDPLELMEELEAVLGIRSCPMNWPIGMGPDFQGVFDRSSGQVLLFEAGRHGERIVDTGSYGLEDPALPDIIGQAQYQQLKDEIELLDVAGDPLDLERVARGELTPIFFGSAMTNFGVGPFLEAFLELGPPPSPKPTEAGELIPPDSERFSGFIFKIQANMNPAHRDRIAFLRICSGRFEKGMAIRHGRLGKEIKLAQPQQFLAQERSTVEEAYAGDIIGLFDPGIFRIGDTLCEGTPFDFTGIPRFSPEHFASIRPRDTLKSKQFKKGLEQLALEGAVQVFYPEGNYGAPEPVLGVVGELQFEVLQYRLGSEYNVEVVLTRLPYEHARWMKGAGFKPQDFQRQDTTCVTDHNGRPVVLFKSDWALRWAEQNHPGLQFLTTAPMGLADTEA